MLSIFSCAYWLSSLEKCPFMSSAFFFFFLLFGATGGAYGSSQVRSRIGAMAAGLHHSHSNSRFKPCLWPTPQLMSRSVTYTTTQGNVVAVNCSVCCRHSLAVALLQLMAMMDPGGTYFLMDISQIWFHCTTMGTLLPILIFFFFFAVKLHVLFVYFWDKPLSLYNLQRFYPVLCVVFSFFSWFPFLCKRL